MAHCIYKMLPVIFSECNWTLWYFCVLLMVKLFLILNDICAQITFYKIDNSSFCQECKVRFQFWQLNQQTFVYCFKSVTWFDIPNWPIIHDQSESWVGIYKIWCAWKFIFFNLVRKTQLQLGRSDFKISHNFILDNKLRLVWKKC